MARARAATNASASQPSSEPAAPAAGNEADTRDLAIQALSTRAPYTRGGIHFASTRTAIVLPDTTTADQTRRLIADTAITLSLVHLASGKSVVVPRDAFDADGQPDLEKLNAVEEALAALVAGDNA